MSKTHPALNRPEAVKILCLLLLAMIFFNCNPPEPDIEGTMNHIAEDYVKLVLAIGQHDADYVDAYYGPEEWRPQGEPVVLKDLSGQAHDLQIAMRILSRFPQPANTTRRMEFIKKQLDAVETKLRMLSGEAVKFDEESRGLYDAVSPRHGADHYESLIADLDSVLPGKGEVSKRLADFQAGFVIPAEKLDTVFQRAIQEARKRTLRHVELPANESFVVEYVTDKAWSGYNWYKGNSFSLIQINTDLDIYIDRAIDLACHEGYPGHHVYNALLEKHMVNESGWMEFSVYPLFSPLSLIAEGSANYGIEVAFPGRERVEFETAVLFPLAGLDPAKAGEYYHVQELRAKLSYAGNDAARAYLDGEMNKADAVAWLGKYALMSTERAEQRLRFIEKYRSYVINYNLGLDMVRNYVERNGGTSDHPERRWELFRELLSMPQTPSGLLR